MKVFCKECGMVFWEGSIIDWSVELSKPEPPKWFLKARKHGPSSNLMVEYPNRTVPLGRKGKVGVRRGP